MGWERRGNRKYYYSTERLNGRSIKHYWPAESGVAMANLKSHQQEVLAAHRLKEQAERDHRQQIDDSLVALSELARTALQALALIEGFHFHRGEWRQRRAQLSPATG